MKKRIEGYWRVKEGDGLPMPEDNGPWEGQKQFLNKLIAVQDRLRPLAYRGWSTCRICKCTNGSMEYQHEGWVWPSGFEHYVRDHNVHPTEQFREFINLEYQKISKKL